GVGDHPAVAQHVEDDVAHDLEDGRHGVVVAPGDGAGCRSLGPWRMRWAMARSSVDSPVSDLSSPWVPENCTRPSRRKAMRSESSSSSLSTCEVRMKVRPAARSWRILSLS